MDPSKSFLHARAIPPPWFPAVSPVYKNNDRFIMTSFHYRALLAINVDGTTVLHFTVHQCRKWMIFQAIILQLVITTVDIILMMRGECGIPPNLVSSLYCHSIAVFALYNKSRPLLLFLWTIFLAEIAYLSYNLATITPRLGFAEDCFVRSSPPSFIFYWYVDTTFIIHLLFNRSPDWIGLSRSHLRHSSSS